jgi:hypothetical protein
VSDIGECGAEVFLRPDLGPVSRRAAVDAFMGLFLPGNIVALAFASDDRIAQGLTGRRYSCYHPTGW